MHSQDHNIGEIFSEHKFKVNVARFSPNGEWVASGDERGKVLIWALNSKRIKLEVQACRKVMDLAWSEDGMKIVAVGDGNESMGKVCVRRLTLLVALRSRLTQD